MGCQKCQSPDRALWIGTKLPLDEVRRGNWSVLYRCPTCGSLWQGGSYEPYDSVKALSFWPYTSEQWDHVHSIEDGRITIEWQDAHIREHWQELPESKREYTQWWRRRTYHQFNPIDEHKHGQNLRACQTADILAFVRTPARPQ